MARRLWVFGVSAAALLFGFLALSACGPSFQAIYEGDARFEHCYAVDENPSAPLQVKSECWRDWSARYTYGQTRDRVQYASLRYRALARVPEAPTDEAMMHAAPGENDGQTALSAPAPTSAFAPPPKTFAEVKRAPIPPAPTRAVDPPPAPRAPAAPGSDCSGNCSRTWLACRNGCDDPASKKSCDSCEKPFRACMRGCFK